MWNFGYHLARTHGALAREAYRVLLPMIVHHRINSALTIDIDVFAYSNEAMLPEQVVSIRSFLKYAGRPKSFTVISDGSHRPYSRTLLQEIDSCVRLAEARDFLPQQLSSRFHDYLANHPTGKQLAAIMSLPLRHPALYVDADVLFFPGAVALADFLDKQDVPALYLPDCQPAGDDRLLRGPAEAANPVNTGVLFFLQKLDWSVAIERFHQLRGSPNFFTNQTMTHLTMHANRAGQFDPAKFVLALSDQFQLGDRCAGKNVVLRHYVNPVRHKFWERVF